MKRSVLVPVAVLGALLFATAATAVAGGMTIWVGRDPNNNRDHWTGTNSSGDNWTLKRNGSDYGSYETVSKGTDYIELKAKGNREPDRLRLYADKLNINERGSRFKFLTLANGKWQK